jgi:hypothetical protein
MSGDEPTASRPGAQRVAPDRAWWDHEQVFSFEAGPRDGEVQVVLTASRQWSISVPGEVRHRYVNVRGSNRYRWVAVGPVDRGWSCSCPLALERPGDPGCPVHRWLV